MKVFISISRNPRYSYLCINMSLIIFFYIKHIHVDKQNIKPFVEIDFDLLCMLYVEWFMYFYFQI